MSTDGDKPDTLGIERAIAGVFSAARHPTRKSPKGGKEGTPGRIYLCGGCDLHQLAVRLCGTSRKKRHGQIKRLPELTGTKYYDEQVGVVEAVLCEMRSRKELRYDTDSWFVGESFLARRKQMSDTMRATGRYEEVSIGKSSRDRRPVRSLSLSDA